MKILIKYNSNGAGYININKKVRNKTLIVKYSNYIVYTKKVPLTARQMFIPKKFAGKRVEVEFE